VLKSAYLFYESSVLFANTNIPHLDQAIPYPGQQCWQFGFCQVLS
jgi:hypothetical protein